MVDDAAVAYIAFYHRFFKGTRLKRCVEAMKIASGDDNFSVYFGADTKAAWESYLRQSRMDAFMRSVSPGAPSRT